MNTMLGREALQAMKRADIQKLCKEYGVKANLKTEALIEHLIDASRPQPSQITPVQPPPRSTSIRIVGQSDARPRGRSNGSVIIHDIDEEEEVVEAEEQSDEQKPPPPVSLTHRTRKAKDTQYRLGVGRPSIAGGSGARAITKSVSRGRKRAKSTRNSKPSEETIVEEPETEVDYFPAAVKPSEQAGPSGTLPISSIPLPTHTEGMSLSSNVVENAVAAALAPVQKELEAQKIQLSELRDKVSSIIETFETRIRGLTTEIESLRTQASEYDAETLVPQAQKMAPQRIPIPPSTPKRVRSPVDSLGGAYLGKPDSSAASSDSSNTNGLLGSQDQETDTPNRAGLLLPGFHSTLPTLGKRPRDSNASATTAFFEFGQEHELPESEIAKRIARPAQKRAKIVSSTTVEDAGESSGPSSSVQGAQTNSGPSQPSARLGFTMFGVPSGVSDFVDLPPPIESLVDFFAPPSPPLMTAPSTSTVGENPFQFAFPPTSTPAHVVFPTARGTFPHPEPPTSPTPANNVDRPGSRQSDRFAIFGHPRSGSGTTGRSASGGPTPGGQENGVNPPAWIGSLQRQPSSNEVASGLGLTVFRTAATEEGTPVPPAHRTMYGTELEGDSRFGDFGVEGVGSGFWASSRP